MQIFDVKIVLYSVKMMFILLFNLIECVKKNCYFINYLI